MSLCFLKVPGRLRRGSGGSILYFFSWFTTHELVFRYANVDYVVVHSTSHNLGPKIVASYDIMCQWVTHLWSCLERFPLYQAEQLNNNIITQVVPKFHLATHKPECHANFSLNFEPGVGQKDMEGPEQTWFGLQGGGSTKDQGPGFWSDSMDDKFSHWNWTKLVGLGKTPCILGGISLCIDLQVRSSRRSI